MAQFEGYPHPRNGNKSSVFSVLSIANEGSVKAMDIKLTIPFEPIETVVLFPAGFKKFGKKREIPIGDLSQEKVIPVFVWADNEARSPFQIDDSTGRVRILGRVDKIWLLLNRFELWSVFTVVLIFGSSLVVAVFFVGVRFGRRKIDQPTTLPSQTAKI